MEKIPLTVTNHKIGAKVSISPRFCYAFKGQNEVNGKEVLGTIVGEIDSMEWVRIQWEGGHSFAYPLDYLCIETNEENFPELVETQTKNTSMGNKVMITES